MDSKELFQNQVLHDIRTIAKELSQIQSFSGLLAHQQKIQNLYEKYIFLKQLNTNKYQQTLDDSEIETLVKEVFQKEPEQDNSNETQNQKIFEDIEKVKTEESPEVIINQWVQKDKEEVTEEIQKTEEKITEEEQQEKVEEVKGLKPINIEIAQIKPVEKEKKLHPIKLDFNDSIAFISQLFNGNKSDMDAEFKALNETCSMEEAKGWMEEMFHKYNWENKEEFVERLSGLIINRFEP